MAPMITPSSTKTRRIAPSLAPSALRMAICLPFSVTMSSSVHTMQKLATAIAMQRIMKVARRSSCSALKRFLFISCQSRTRTPSSGGAPSGRFVDPASSPSAPSTAPRSSSTLSGSGTRTSICEILSSSPKKRCASSIRT
jgi:hypothetical protein